MSEQFDDFVERATGHRPYPYQRLLAARGLPELLDVETGCGKTEAAILPWLYRRLCDPDERVQAATPRWLMFVLPMRSLVEQTYKDVYRWLDRDHLGMEDEVGLYKVMGGEDKVGSGWRHHPERTAIFIGTLDMLLSRALNRGYGASRWSWPIEFGLFNSGCQWVFDEVQLMGPALPTSLQLEGLRRLLGTANTCSSMWMSATLDTQPLSTFDFAPAGPPARLTQEDIQGPLGPRIRASKTVRRVGVSSDPRKYEREIARVLVEHHRPGTRTIAVLNTVDRARRVYDEVVRAGGADPVLLHSRFRPADRAAHLEHALAEIDPDGAGRIVVATQVLEAGVDVDACVLLTEAAPWPSIVQRAGRCNREGLRTDALLLWVPPLSLERAAPYEPGDVAASVEALDGIEGERVTPSSLRAVTVEVQSVEHPVLRRRDLMGLFDTTPDLSGNDLDVGRFLRGRSDLDLQVAWRSVGTSGPSTGDPVPTAEERCPVPVRDLRDRLKTQDAWRYDHIDRRWVTCRPADLRPGMVLVLAAKDGGYDAVYGWDPSRRTEVEAIEGEWDSESLSADTDEATDGDPGSYEGVRWLPLARHLQEVEEEVRKLTGLIEPEGLTEAQVEAAAIAGRLHDIGKVHEVFQEALGRSAAEGEEPGGPRSTPRPWAKGGGRRPIPPYERHHFRHELASALALLGDAGVALEGVDEPDLVVYLVAAHHGKVRLGFRSLPKEYQVPDDPATRVALGIVDGEELPAVDIGTRTLPPTTLSLAPMSLGGAGIDGGSWLARTAALRDRPDLGPFRLAFLEALVRLADGRASALVGDRS